MTPLCEITFVVLLISVVNVDLFLNSRHLWLHGYTSKYIFIYIHSFLSIHYVHWNIYVYVQCIILNRLMLILLYELLFRKSLPDFSRPSLRRDVSTLTLFYNIIYEYEAHPMRRKVQAYYALLVIQWLSTECGDFFIAPNNKRDALLMLVCGTGVDSFKT